jgi:hypothetical protein
MIAKYIEAEKRLAELLLGSPGISPIDGQRFKDDRPKWACDNAAAFELMVEHDVELDIGVGSEVHSSCPEMRNYLTTYIGDHPDKKAAVRFAIVRAVITKLEAAKK